MDYSSLPNIVALALLITTYRPLVRRSGGHVNLWFVGWTFVLCNCINQLLTGSSGAGSGWPMFISTATLVCAGLFFLTGAANSRERVIPWRLMLALAAAPLAQAVLISWQGSSGRLLLPAANALYLLPTAIVAAYRRPWTRPVLMVSAAFALFGLTTVGLAAHPLAMRAGALLLIYLSAAYLTLRTAEWHTRGVLATALGLTLWGVKYTFVLLMTHFHPSFGMNRALLQMPEYLVVGGSLLSMIEERLAHAERLATHDPLTNLPNRRRFQERFAEALKEARAERTTVACLVIDVDNFKRINDTMGHSAGDALLRALAVRLAWHMSPRDVLARTGGDEFTAMLAGVSNEHYLRFVAGAMMSAVSVPVQVEGQPVDVRISMGIALSPDDADEIDDLVRLADQAMYRAKRRGGNVLAFASDLSKPEEVPVRSNSAQILHMMPARGAAANDR